MALSKPDSIQYVLGLPVEFLVENGVSLPCNAWESLINGVPDTTLVPYRPVLIHDLVSISHSELLKKRGFGKQIVNSILHALSKLQLCLGMKDLGPAPTPEQRFEAAVRHQLLPPKGLRVDVRLPRLRLERNQEEVRILFRTRMLGSNEINTLEQAYKVTTEFDVEVIGLH